MAGLALCTQAGVAAVRFDPAGATIGELRAALDAHATSSEALVTYYLGRIARFDKQGPRINAIISLNPDALAQARRLDLAARRPGRRRPLYGIPFIAKDNYDTAGIPTSGGSAVLRHSIPAQNAFVVQRLLDEGAILIGKANLSELAASYRRLGYSSAGGLTVNPYNTARDVSGSSSGSAAAVAADFAVFALGTDTAGSVRGPASVAALVGLRPTLGLTSRSGVIPLSLTFDTTGILARSVPDTALVLDAIAGPDPTDAATGDQPLRTTAYAAGLDPQALQHARVGVVSNFRGGNPEVDQTEQRALATLQAAGATLVPIELPRAFEELWESVLGPVGQAEFKPQFERYLGMLSAAQPHTLSEFIARSESAAVSESATPVNPARLAALRDALDTPLTDSPSTIRLLTRIMPALRGQLQALMAAQNLQALVFSTMSCPAAPRFDRADASFVCFSRDSYRASYVAAATGFPEITVPMGRVSANMPVGLSFLGLPYEEASLLALAGAFEDTRARPAAPVLR